MDVRRDDYMRIVREFSSARLSRRQLVKRTAALGLAVPAVSALLAACDDDDADDTADAADVTDDDDSDDVEDTDDSDDDADADDTDEDDRYGGRMVIVSHGSIDNLHPDHANSANERVNLGWIFDALIEVDEVNDLDPELATDYEISDDGLEYTFNLREGVLWHDGEPFTSEDVKVSFDWYLDPDNASITRGQLGTLEEVEATEELVAVLRMGTPNAPFIRSGALAGIFAAHKHEELGYEGYTNDPVGTGPFRVVSWAPDDQIVYEPFEDHWRGRPYLDELVYRVVPEEAVRALELESGNADSSIWNLLVDDSLRLQDDPNFTTFALANTSLNHFAINNTRPQFEEREVRRALMHAIDREALIEQVFAGAATIARSHISPAIDQWQDPSVPDYEYDPDLAQEMLDEAGWEIGDNGVRQKDGVELAFECLVLIGDEARRPQAEMVQEQLSQIGIDMAIREAADVNGPMRDGDADMILINATFGGGNGDPDGGNTRGRLHSTGGNNTAHLNNPEMDALIEAGEQEMDDDARWEIYSDIQHLFVQEVPILYMMYWDWFYHFGPRVHGLPEQVLAREKVFRKVYEYWVED